MNINITLPSSAKRYSSYQDWIDTQKSSKNDGIILVGHPQKFPCYGWPVHTEYNEDGPDKQYFSFICPSKK